MAPLRDHLSAFLCHVTDGKTLIYVKVPRDRLVIESPVAVARLGWSADRPRCFFQLRAGRLQHHQRDLQLQLTRLNPVLPKVTQVYLLQARLCDHIESIADHLPRINDRANAVAMPLLTQALPSLQKFEEVAILPIIRRLNERNLEFSEIEKQIRRDHVEDLEAAEDLVEILRTMTDVSSPHQAEYIGYRLRSFFDMLGRHLNWECKFLLPLMTSPPTRRECQDMQRQLPAKLHYWSSLI